MKKISEYSFSKNIVAAVLLIIGLCFVVLSSLNNCVSHFRLATIKTDKPKTYEFHHYNNLLKQYVKNGLVNYQSLLKDKEIDIALSELERTSPLDLGSSKAKLAFWINVYNLLVVKNIIDYYPVVNLDELGQSTKQKKFVVGGKLYTIYEIENNELNKLVKEVNPSTIFLICPGAIGYPSLTNHAVQLENIDADSENAIFNFVNSAKSHVWTSDTQTFKISRFFLWNENILKTKYTSGFALVNNYLPNNKKIDFNNRHIKYGYLPYFDFRLNDSNAIHNTQIKTDKKQKS
jgi:hypothetical protein